MSKSLKDLVEDSSKKKKDLTGILKEFEESYIYRGIDWVDKSLSLKKRYPDSKIAKSFDYGKDFLFYSSFLGILPQEKQEKYAEHMGYNPLKFTNYSLILGFTICGAKTATALISPDSIALSLYVWGGVLLLEDLTRLTYTLVKKRPIGSFIYTEIPYRVIKPIFKKINKFFNKRDNNLYQEKSIPQKDNLNISW